MHTHTRNVVSTESIRAYSHRTYNNGQKLPYMSQVVLIRKAQALRDIMEDYAAAGTKVMILPVRSDEFMHIFNLAVMIATDNETPLVVLDDLRVPNHRHQTTKSVPSSNRQSIVA